MKIYKFLSKNFEEVIVFYALVRQKDVSISSVLNWLRLLNTFILVLFTQFPHVRLSLSILIAHNGQYASRILWFKGPPTEIELYPSVPG